MSSAMTDPADRTIPPSPLGLGLAGLLPFWGLALILWTGPIAGFGGPQADLALAAYAALILSFLGGIRWGLATRHASQEPVAAQYAVAVMPSLLAWATLALPEPWRLAGLGALLLVLGPMDRQLCRQGLAPAWYGRLRLILSAGAGLALWIGAAALSR